ncbi:hypothetical protein EJ02DRAFT_451125 [Clathrospora elynae]|uniref:Uncharacterized protein n=1 Tax=Clathrospora elynae TaxID=706981 RepID=A0A6A5T082_9PLEO|nr:hypothetical protein EJ02DRAFT_451125 [Clathrospora elynae]
MFTSTLRTVRATTTRPTFPPPHKPAPSTSAAPEPATTTPHPHHRILPRAPQVEPRRRACRASCTSSLPR